jgi:hypothetical protein
MRLPSQFVASMAILLAAGLTASAADARHKRKAEEPPTGFVTAESRYGPQTITAPVRISEAGRREVQLPGGTWIQCRRSCSETLRQETIDFWHIRNNPGGESGQDGPGYFRFDWSW